jgi:hypothetical protein
MKISNLYKLSKKAREIVDLGNDIVNAINMRGYRLKGYDFFPTFNFSKMIESVSAIRCLCRHHFYSDAIIIFRSTLEQHFNSEFISRDKEPRSKRFIDYANVKYNELIQSIKELGFKTGFSEENEKNITKVVEGYKSSSSDKRWAEMSLYDMAKELGGKHFAMYKSSYKPFCDFAHSGFFSLLSLQQSKQGEGLFPNDTLGYYALLLSTSLLCRECKRVNDYFKLGFEQKIKEVAERYKGDFIIET